MTRFTIAFATIGLLLSAAAAEAEDCGPIKMINQVHMTRVEGSNLDFVPFTINGQYTQFLFATAASMTQISDGTARDLKLIEQPGNGKMYHMDGRVSDIMASVPEFGFGVMHGTHGYFPVAPELTDRSLGYDGLLALDYLRKSDVEVDFGTDMLNLFSPDHCPGHVIYWPAPAVAIIPFTRSQDEQQIVVAVTLDGKPLNALIDTGSAETGMRVDIAESQYNLTLGAADTPEYGASKTYRHVFGTLSFGDVAVTNPHVNIFQNTMGNSDDRWGRVTKAYQVDIVNAPQLIIGMDVLRKLRLFMAFGEGKLYVTPASPPGSVAPSSLLQAVYKKATLATIASMTQQLAGNSHASGFLNNLCFLRATVKADLDAARDICNRANDLQPHNEHIMDNMAFVLYQQGNYKDAITAYDANLALHPRHADSLFMRGYAKGKLGDQAGKDADIAAAKAINPGIASEFSQYDIDY